MGHSSSCATVRTGYACDCGLYAVEPLADWERELLTGHAAVKTGNEVLNDLGEKIKGRETELRSMINSDKLTLAELTCKMIESNRITYTDEQKSLAAAIALSENLMRELSDVRRMVRDVRAGV